MAQLNDLLVLGKASFLDAVKAPSFTGSFVGNASTATALETPRTIFGKTFDGTQNVVGQPLVYGAYVSNAASRYNNSGIQVRENGLVGNAQSDIGYAPSIGFHWSGRIAATLLFHSDGNFYLRKQDGTTRASLDANLIGNASTATNFSSAAVVSLIGDILGSASSTKGWEITTAIAHKTLDADYATKFRTEVKGDANSGSFIRTIRTNTASVAGLPQYGSGLGWGGSDTHGYLYVHYNSPQAYIGGGNADKLNWKNLIALADGSNTFSGTNSFTGTNAFSGVVKISAGNSYQNASQCKMIIGNSASAFVIGGDGLQCYSDVWSAASNSTTALTGKVLHINYYGGNVIIGKSDRSATVTLYGTHAMDGLTNFSNGHIYLTGSSANSSTGNTTQLVFGTATTNHIALSANTKALILNPTTSSTTNQIILALDQISKIPSGIEVGAASEFKGTVVFSKSTDANGTANNSPAVIIGGAASAGHIEIDANEIMAKASGTTAGPLYLNNDGGLVYIGNGGLSVASTATIGTDLTVNGQIYAKKNIYINSTAGGGSGLSLHGSSAPTTYGIHMSTTANFGVHGDVVSDWATYFNMNAVGQRGWIYRAGSTNVASISCNGIGTFNGVGDNNSYLAYPKGGTYTGGSTETGYLRITLPVGFTSTMLKFKLSLYNYSTGTSVDYMIGGYNYSGDSKWYNPTVTVLGKRNSPYYNLTVRFGSNGSKAAITIGEAGDNPTVWSYPNIAISDVTLGHGRVYDDWQGDWTIDFTTTALTNITQTYSDPYIGNFSGTSNKVVKFTNSGKDLTNSNITDDGSTITLGTKVVLKGNGSSFNEGLRILPASNGWANIFFSADQSVSGAHDGGWLIGRRGAAGAAHNSVTPAIGDFTIEEQDSNGVNLTIHKNSGGATLRGRFRTDSEIQTSSANAVRMINGKYGTFLRNDGSYTYFLATAADDQYGSWNDLRPFYFSNSTGAVTMSNGLTVTNNASIKNLLTVGTGSSHHGIRAGDVYIASIGQNLILQNLGALRFGADSWDYNVWAGLKYDSANKYIYLGLADGTVFTSNANQSGGRILTPGISYLHVGNQTTYYMTSGGAISGSTLLLTSNISYANDSYTNYEVIKFKTGDNNGAGIVIGGGGAVVIGSGESASAVYDALSLTGGTETTYITSDQAITFFSNCQTVANRVGMTYTTSGQLHPSVTNTGSVGTSGAKWNAMYATTFYGDLSGTATYATRMTLNGISNNTLYGTYGGIIQNSSTGPESGNWHNTFRILHNNSTGYYTDIAVNFTGSHGMWYKSYRGGTASAWYRVAAWNLENTFSAINTFNELTRMNKTLIVTSQIGNYGEGIRLNASDGQWATITLGSSGDTGTGTNCWSIHRKSDNNFCISKNSSDGANGLVMTTTGMGLGTTAPAYRLHVAGDIYANGGWVRVSGNQGLFFQSHGGGWYMTDSTYIRAYNGKMVYSSGRFLGDLVPSSWIAGQNTNNGAYNVNDYSNDGSYNPWMRAKNTHANVKKYFSFGTLGKQFYWIGSTTDRTDNGFDKGMTFNVESGLLYASIVGGDRVYTGYDSGQTGSVSCSNWFRSNGDSGWYNATHGCHVMPNIYSSYGSVCIRGGEKGGYEGLHFGSNNTGLTVMSIMGSHQGLYNQSKTGWIIYTNAANGLISLGGSSPVDGYKVTTNGNHYIGGSLRVTSTSTLNGAVIANRGTSTSTGAYGDAAVEIREYNFGGAQTDTWGYAPRLSFHWSNRVAAQIGLASNGNLYIQNNTAGGGSFSMIMTEAIADGRYVNVSGDTMTGHLYANNGLTWTNAYWTAPGNITCNKNSAGSEFSFDMGAGTQWHVWSTPQSRSILSCWADNSYVQVPVHLYVGSYNHTGYALSTSSFICESWIRTTGATGWYNESYGGGWYMTDSTYVRTYNNKPVLANNSYYVGTANGAGTGLSLYSTSSPDTYGIHMSTTANFGTCGNVSSDWATYFCFHGDANRGWIFRHAGSNVASINGSGIIYTPAYVNTGCLMLNNISWTGYGTANPVDAGLTPVVGRVYFKLA